MSRFASLKVSNTSAGKAPMSTRSIVEWFCLGATSYASYRYPRKVLLVCSACAAALATKRWWRRLLIKGARGPLCTATSHVLLAQEQIADEFTRFIHQNGGDGCGILLVDSPKGRLEVATGMLSSFSRQKADSKTRFEIASVAKTMIAYAVLKLCRKGPLSLDSEACHWLSIEGLGKVTLRQLLTHTSGLPDFWSDPPVLTVSEWAKDLERPSFVANPLSALWCHAALAVCGHTFSLNSFFFRSVAVPLLHCSGSERIWVPEDVLQIVFRDHPINTPGNYHYADTNYIILGMLLEKIHNKPLHHLLHDEVFAPIGMSQTYVRFDYHNQVDHGAEDHRLSTRYRSKGAFPIGKFAWTFPDHSLALIPFLGTVPARYVSADWASGGVVSNAPDLCAFMKTLRADQEMWESMTAPLSSASYGFGIMSIDLAESCGTLVGHAGNGGSCVCYWPQRDMIFAGTTNNNITSCLGFVKEMITSGRMRAPPDGDPETKESNLAGCNASLKK